MKINFKIRFWDILITSLISLFITIQCYSALFPNINWSNLTDFYTGISVFENHNKYLDIFIYFIYLFLFFIILPFINLLRDKFFKDKMHEQKEFIFLEKIKLFCNKFKNLQYIFPFGYIFLHPLNGHFYPKIAFIILVLILLSLADIYQRNKNSKGFSPFAVTALFFILCFNVYYTGAAPTDDHHFGEKFAVFLMHNNFNLDYYKDVMLVHGLTDIIPSFLGSFFFEQNNIYGYSLGEILKRNIMLILSVLASLFVFNFNILYILPILLLKVPSFTVISFSMYLLLLKDKIINNPSVFFWIYITVSILFASYWTTMGSFFVLASLPVFFYVSKKLQNKKFHFSLACFLILILSIIFRNNVFDYFHQAEYYIKGTLYAFGNNFAYKESKMPVLIAYEWLYKMFALFFIPVIIIELINMIKNKTVNQKNIFFAVFCILFVIASLPYTMGRLDNGLFLRIEYISTAFLCIVMPYWFYKFSDNFKKIKFEKLMLLILFFFLIFTSIKIIPNKIKQIRIKNGIYTSNLYNTGNIKLDEINEKRLTEIKNYLYSKDKNSSFLDLTNRGMHYLYFNKKIPVQFTSFYNSIASKQAVETVERLRNNVPDYILIYSNNILHDGVFPSLRINALYRWIFLKQNYKYEKAGDNIFLVKTDSKPVYTQEQFDDLDYYLGSGNLKYLPEVWANSIKTLPLIRVVRNYTVENYGKEIKIRFFEPEKIKDMDLMYFDTGEKALTNYKITINNSNSKILCKSKSGKILVPLDNFPSWLLNDNVKEITIETNIEVKLPNAEFYNRIYNHSLL